MSELFFESGELSGCETFLATGLKFSTNRRTIFINPAAELTFLTA
jgi:hypothetical protein